MNEERAWDKYGLGHWTWSIQCCNHYVLIVTAVILHLRLAEKNQQTAGKKTRMESKTIPIRTIFLSCFIFFFFIFLSLCWHRSSTHQHHVVNNEATVNRATFLLLYSDFSQNNRFFLSAVCHQWVFFRVLRRNCSCGDRTENTAIRIVK